MGRQTMVGVADLPYVIGCTPSSDDLTEAAVDGVYLDPANKAAGLRGGEGMG